MYNKVLSLGNDSTNTIGIDCILFWTLYKETATLPFEHVCDSHSHFKISHLCFYTMQTFSQKLSWESKLLILCWFRTRENRRFHIIINSYKLPNNITHTFPNITQEKYYKYQPFSYRWPHQNTKLFFKKLSIKKIYEYPDIRTNIVIDFIGKSFVSFAFPWNYLTQNTCF